MALNVIDLFSGCGGLSAGLEQVGFKVVAGVDFDESALRTFKHNHPGSTVIHADLSDGKAMDQIQEKIGKKKN